MSAHSFLGRGKCPPLFFQGGANVLPLVSGRGKCPGRGANGREANVRLPSKGMEDLVVTKLNTPML